MAKQEEKQKNYEYEKIFIYIRNKKLKIPFQVKCNIIFFTILVN